MILPSFCAGVAQLVEHFLAKEDVASSSLVTRSLLPREKGLPEPIDKSRKSGHLGHIGSQLVEFLAETGRPLPFCRGTRYPEDQRFIRDQPVHRFLVLRSDLRRPAWAEGPAGEESTELLDLLPRAQYRFPNDGRNTSHESKFIKIDVPGAAGVTEPFGINPQGDIVGTYSDGSGNTHGFVLTQE
jgi:hypothetical protein